MRYAFIFNPVAGRNGTGRMDRMKDLATAAGFDAPFFATEGPGHAIELTESAVADGYEAIIAVGGDGTVKEVAAGIVSSKKRVHLGVIPAGTGNDFARMLNLPKKIDAAFHTLRKSRPANVDYGIVRWNGRDYTNESIFVNAIGVGFDARVAREVNAVKKLPGLLSYLVAGIRTVRRWESPEVRLTNGVAQEQSDEIYRGRLFMVTAGNGKSSGGGFLFTPGARLTDGFFDVCIVEPVSLTRALQLIPRVLAGKHTTAPEVHMYRKTSLRITSMSDLPIHADGEILTLSARAIEIEIVTGGISVLVISSLFETD